MNPAVAQFLQSLRWQDLLDILLVSFVLYRFFLLIKGTRAVQLLRGMLLLLLAYLVSHALGPTPSPGWCRARRR